MNITKASNHFFWLALLVVAIFPWGCSQPQSEVVNIEEVLPENVYKEITSGHPDFKVILVTEKDANVAVQFGEKHLQVAGIEDEALRERLANLIIEYLDNPNKKAEKKAQQEAYEALPPQEKMAQLVERIKSRHPEFSYEWVGLEEGNTKIVYIDNGLIVNGVDDEGTREEIAQGVYRIQQEIDKESKGEQE